MVFFVGEFRAFEEAVQIFEAEESSIGERRDLGMRFRFLIVCVTAFFSFGGSSNLFKLQPAAWDMISAGRSLIEQVFHYNGSHHITIQNRGEVECAMFHSFPYTYIVCEKETLRSTKWDKIEPLQTYQEDVYQSLNVYSTNSVCAEFNNDSVTDCRKFILMEYVFFDEEILSSALVRSVQLDEDEERERIVQAYAWPSHQYFIYDLQNNKWTLVRQVDEFDKSGSYPDLDTTIQGVIGLREIFYSWGFGNEAYDYYKIERDTLREMFALNQSCYESEFASSESHTFSMNSDVKITRKKESINLNYSVIIYCNSEPHQTGPILDVSNFTLIIATDDQGNFIADKNDFFVYSSNRDPVLYFSPINYVYKRLYELMMNGSAHQKKIIKGFDFQYYLRAWLETKVPPSTPAKNPSPSPTISQLPHLNLLLR